MRLFLLILLPSRRTDARAPSVRQPDSYLPPTHRHTHTHTVPTYRAVQVVGVPEAVQPDLGNERELLSAPHPRPGGFERNKFHAPIVGQNCGPALREGEERSRVGLWASGRFSPSLGFGACARVSSKGECGTVRTDWTRGGEGERGRDYVPRPQGRRERGRAAFSNPCL